MKKRLLVLIGIVIAALIVAGIMFATKGEESAQERPAVSETPSATEQRNAPEEKETKKNSDVAIDLSPAITSAEKIYSEFQANAIAAELKHGNKIIEVTGVIGEIGSDALGSYVQLIGDKAKAGYAGLRFYIDGEEKKKAALLENGQTVTLRGKLTLSLKASSFIIPFTDTRIVK